MYASFYYANTAFLNHEVAKELRPLTSGALLSEVFFPSYLARTEPAMQLRSGLEAFVCQLRV